MSMSLCGPLGDGVEQPRGCCRACFYCLRGVRTCEEVVMCTGTVKSPSRLWAVCPQAIWRALWATPNSFLLLRPTTPPISWVLCLCLPGPASLPSGLFLGILLPSPFHHSDSYFTSKGQFETLPPLRNFQYQLNPFQLHIKKTKTKTFHLNGLKRKRNYCHFTAKSCGRSDFSLSLTKAQLMSPST